MPIGFIARETTSPGCSKAGKHYPPAFYCKALVNYKELALYNLFFYLLIIIINHYPVYSAIHPSNNQGQVLAISINYGLK